MFEGRTRRGRKPQTGTYNSLGGIGSHLESDRGAALGSKILLEDVCGRDVIQNRGTMLVVE